MHCINDYLFVTFNPNERFTKMLPGGMELIMPYNWDYLDEYGQKNGKRVENIDYKQTNQQVAYLLIENPKYPHFKKGDKLIFHYLGMTHHCNLNGMDGGFIQGNDVFFTDNDGIQMAPGHYLCEQMFDDIPQTPSGIYIGFIEQKRECHLKVLYSGGEYQTGDIVFSIDGAQYELEYEGKRYIKLLESEIVGMVHA